MRRIAATLSAVFMIFYPAGHGKAAGEPTAAAQEIDFYAATVLPAMNKVKKAMPPTPAGWVVAGETKRDSLPRSAHDQTALFLHFIYQIKYQPRGQQDHGPLRLLHASPAIRLSGVHGADTSGQAFDMVSAAVRAFSLNFL
ncbi:MAG: hypothetical protein M0Z89_06080 [Nitrospiraceae bacterium]|nr:hypothetical protein [Nitrospiraceae bacterium]